MSEYFNNEIRSILENNFPDKEFELFWLGFKQSIINFSKIYDVKIPIQTWSNILNWYQVQKDYCNIKKHIHIYISYYATYIFRYADTYHTSILWTNVKRWNKITNNYRFDDSENKKLYFNIYHLLLDIFRTILLGNKQNKEILEFYKDISEDIREEDLYIMVDLCIKFKLGNIIDKINTYKNFNSYIEDRTNIKLPPKISGKKIIDMIN